MNPDPLVSDSLACEGLETSPAHRVELESLNAAMAPALPALTPLADGLTAGQLLQVDAPGSVAAPAKRKPHWKRKLALVQVCCLAFFAYVALFHISVVRGSSMAPGIHDGDRIVVDHFAYLLGPVKRGDVVVLKYPLDPSLDYIKRVIGLPGDEIMIDQGQVWVNGKELTEPYVASADPLSRTFARVQPAHYFVLGDNRPRSSDSREFGQVPMDYVRGRVEVRLWPISRIGAVH
ncbi:MAG: signal peptidase I [Planctomycetota bacterium]